MESFLAVSGLCPFSWYNLRAGWQGIESILHTTSPPHLYFSWLLSKYRGKNLDHVSSTERQKRNIHTWILKIPVNDKRLVVFIAVFLGIMPRQMFSIGQNSQSNLKLICNAKSMKHWYLAEVIHIVCLFQTDFYNKILFWFATGHTHLYYHIVLSI